MAARGDMNREISVGIDEILSNFVSENRNELQGALNINVDDLQEEEEEVVMHQTSPSAPLVASLVQRIDKVMNMMRAALDVVTSAARTTASTPPPAAQLCVHHEEASMHHFEAEGFSAAKSNSQQDALDQAWCHLRRIRDLLYFLWTRLLNVLGDENQRCADSYAQTLDIQERIPAFEELTRIIYRRPDFCEIIGEIIDTVYDNRPFPEELVLRVTNPQHPNSGSDDNTHREDPGQEQHIKDTERRLHGILKEHYQEMIKMQRVATLCGVMVIEGARESFLEPLGMHELCKKLMSEKVRQKRIVPLCLMFCLLDQDDTAVGEAMVQGVPRQLLQWLRHLSHRLFGQTNEATTIQFLQEAGGEEGELASSSGASTARFQGLHPTPQLGVGLLTPAATSTLLGGGSPFPGTSPLVSPVPSRPLTVSFPAEPDVRTTQTTLPAGEMAPVTLPTAPSWSTLVRPADNLISRWKTQQEVSNAVNLNEWVPKVGDLVGRGPCWRFGSQGRYADYGVVVGVAGKEVLVTWILSEDAPKSALAAPRQVFRYQFTFPCFEVVRLEEYLKVKTTKVDKEVICIMEFVWVCAVAGILCQQQETIQHVLQFQTTQAMGHVLDVTDIATSHFRVDMVTEEAEMRGQQQLEQMKYLLGSDNGSLRTKSEEEWVQTFLPWDSRFTSAKARFRMDRECITRAGWTLNALLGHKKLAYQFLEYDGVRSLLRLTQGPLEVSTTYGCCIILSRLGRSAVFEELLRKNDHYFESIMSFIMTQWMTSKHNDVQTSAGAFLFHTLSFPCVLRYFDRVEGAPKTVELLKSALTSSEEQHDVLLSNLQLTALRCLNTYLVAHLILSTNVIFRKHRSISTLVRNTSPFTSLPRDPVQIETILGHLSAPTPSLPDVTLDNVQSRLTLECLTSIQQLLDQGLLRILLRCIQFYYVQSRWELLIAALQSLHVLTVIPQTRPLLIESRGRELSGVAHLLMIVGDLSNAFRATGNNGSSSREAHLIPCLVTALHVLIHTMTPPPPEGAVEDTAGAVAFFNSTCSLFRASDGVRTLLEVLKNKKDASFSAKLKYFPVVARAVQLMVVLRRYADTSQLFEALGVHDVAYSLGQLYLPVQRKLTPDGSPSEHDPANRFMENLQILKKRSFEDGSVHNPHASAAGGGGVISASYTDAIEIDQRQAIVARAVIDYNPDSLLELMARHLETEGLQLTAQMLRKEGGLIPTLTGTTQPLSVGGGGVNGLNTAASSTPPPPSLDDIIRVYLRQQQEHCTNPIETLPQFNLTKSHVYQPLPLPTDSTRGVLNRMLHRKLGRPYTKHMCVYDTCFTYNNPCFLFDVTGVGEGLLGESICFVDDGNALAIGTSEGGLTLFETFVDGSDDKVIEQHMVFDNEGITALTPSPDGQFLAAVREDLHAVVMRRSALPVPVAEFEGCEAVRMSHDSRYALCTFESKSCKLYDIESKKTVRTLNENALSNGSNDRNVAIFDPSSQLVLYDAVLWDWRCSNAAVFRFDRFSESFAAVFHPNNKQVIMDERVWDLRTRGMLYTVPTLHHTTSFHISQAGRALYSFRERNETTESVVSAVDSLSYEIIFSGEVHPTFKAFAVDPSDRYCAAILEQDTEAVIRVFSTSSGYDRYAFAAPNLPDERDEPSDAAESDGEDEWSIGSSADEESSRIDYSSDEEEEGGSSGEGDNSLALDDASVEGSLPSDSQEDEDSESTSGGFWREEEEEEELEASEGTEGEDGVLAAYEDSDSEEVQGGEEPQDDGGAEAGERRSRKRRRSRHDFIPSDPDT